MAEKPTDEKCEFCDQLLVGGQCFNPECDLSDSAPAISDRADLSEQTFLPDLDFDDEDESMEDVLPEISKDEDQIVPAMGDTAETPAGQRDTASSPEISVEASAVDLTRYSKQIEATKRASRQAGDTDIGPEVIMPTGGTVAESGIIGPFLSLEQAAIPIDHTGTIHFEGKIGEFDTHSEILPSENATRLTDDEHYREIKSMLRESVSDNASDMADDTDRANEVTGKPEISRTIRVLNPAEEHRTLHRLPSRDLSVPSDSASLEKRKQARKDDKYSLDSKDYTIVDKVGEGGSGVVYKAEQTALNRTVAVKVLKQRRMKAGSRSRTRTKELEKRKSRFLHEVHITAKLQHPNIIPLYDLGINAHGEVFYSMKLIDESSAAGEEVQQSWASLVRVSPKDSSREVIEKNVGIFAKVCDAMRYAHSEKIVHRDLKPDNVMVGQFGEVLVIDWGMALDLSKGHQPFTAGGTTSYMPPEMGLHYLKQSEMHKLSHKLMVSLGETRRDVYVEGVLDHGVTKAATDLFNSPTTDDEMRKVCDRLIKLDRQEQALAKQVNISSDIYLLGAILYEIAVGHPPHFVPQNSCKNAEEKHQREFWLSSNHRIQRLVKINDPLRLSLCNIAHKAMQKDQQDRFQSVEELQEEIRGFNKQVQALALVSTGKESLEKAKGGEGYMHLLPAMESFRGARSLWPESEEAHRLQTETVCEYARRADHRKDFDAGLSIIDEYTDGVAKKQEAVVTLKSKLERGKQVAKRNRRLAQIGWVAAVVLPIGVFLAAFYGTQKLRQDNIALVAQGEQAKVEVAQAQEDVDAAKQNVEDTKMELASQQNLLLASKEELKSKNDELNMKIGMLKTQEDKLATSQMLLTTTQEEVAAKEKLVTAKTMEVNLKTNELKAKNDELGMRDDELRMKVEELTRQTKELQTAQKDATTAKLEVAVAKKDVAKAQEDVDKIRLQSSEDQFKALLNPIPLDIRKGKVEQAQKRLEDLRESELNPQFKNGWVARHFAKVINVSGVENKLGKNTSIIDVLHGANDSLFIVGTQDGKRAVWQTNSKTGQTSALKIQLPNYGRLAHAAISPDGKWLALAMDDVASGADFEEHFWLVDLQTGRRAWSPSASKTSSGKNDSVVGCQLIGFNDSGSGLQLVTVEELSAYKGLKQRVQIATRSVSAQSQSLDVGVAKTTPIDATSRGTENVRSIAAISRVKGNTTIAIIYQSLDADGRDGVVMETLVADGQGKFRGTKVDIDQFPTAMHVGSKGQFYCGYADGKIKQFAVGGSTSKPTLTNSEHEAPVTVLSSSADGKLVSGSRDGVLIVFDNQLKIVKRLVGQSDELTSVSITDSKSDNGFQLASGGSRGHLRVWNPESTLHDATIDKRRSITSSPRDMDDGEIKLTGSKSVTCGAVDQYYKATDVPATAYGMADGTVYYLNPTAMRTDQGVEKISPGANGLSRLSIDPPPGSFDTSFGEFDSFGIVDDEFVLLQSDGQLFTTTIDKNTKIPSSKLSTYNVLGSRAPDGEFTPLLASQTNQPFFFTTDPGNDARILVWTKQGSGYRPSLATGSSQSGRIRRLSLSPDGRWLAVVRAIAQKNTTGQYLSEVFEVQRGNSDQVLRSASRTNSYRVGDPAFVGFSKDSREMILHFHKLGVDRETWLENWSLSGSSWEESNSKRRIDNRKVDLIAWDGNDSIVTKINKRFYVTSRTSDRKQEIGKNNSAQLSNKRLRSVRPTGSDGSQYVLYNQGLERFDEQGNKSSTRQINFKNARDVRVFGDQAVVLDDVGFHLVDADLRYISLIARRKIASSSLALSNDRLAICYDVGGLCRIMDVSSGTPKEIGRIDGATKIAISPDATWAACERNGELQIYNIRQSFNNPVETKAIASEHWAIQWIGTDDPKLLIGAQMASGDLAWSELDPGTRQFVDSKLKLPSSISSGDLVEFELAPKTKKYMAIISREGSSPRISLWGVSENVAAQQFSLDEGMKNDLSNPQSVTFSEMDHPEINKIGTRLVVLSGGDSQSADATSLVSRIFMVTDALGGDDTVQAGAGGPATKIYRSFEIEGVIEVTDGRQLIDSHFSGDGQTLLEVDTRGVKILLSKDW